ncbi:MAG TPA: acyl-ACP thioesterase domain-containing protein [Anaeromyxobacter sp.]|nr:acyl-ACP thioesterase domain-containing protein [Anaeromyxobacter sp.]
METYREAFAVHSYDADAFGALAVPALCDFLVEAATLHATELGVPLEALRAKGLTWVLARARVDVLAPIRLGDRVEVETWPSGVERLLARRDFRVRGADGAELARATTGWSVLDLSTRRPVRPETILLDPRFPPGRLPSVVELSPRLPELPAWDEQRRFQVRYQDIDANLHVNNASYVAWALEAVPRDVWSACRLAGLEVHYLAECHHGSTILSRRAAHGDGAFAHAVVREEDGRELARVATRWVKR